MPAIATVSAGRHENVAASERPFSQAQTACLADQPTSPATAENQTVADMLREAADLLDAQGANRFRVAAYRKAGDTIGDLTENLRALFERDGRDGLDRLPAVGEGISATIAEILITGHWAQLDRLRGEVDAVQLFRTIPGVGSQTAEQLHDELGVDTLEALEVAALKGQLQRVPGIGPRRAAAIRAALTQLLDRTRSLRSRRTRVDTQQAPPIDMLLEVDHEYRTKATAGKLPAIAPRRFNPSGEKTLPVLHARRGEWHFTALYSNTAKAHELGRERDWVVIYSYDNDHAERQNTAVTETRGSLAGKRVIRGREDDCRALYAAPI
jgi:DNA polymerase (family X)